MLVTPLPGSYTGLVSEYLGLEICSLKFHPVCTRDHEYDYDTQLRATVPKEEEGLTSQLCKYVHHLYRYLHRL